MKRIAFVFPTMWDERQLASCRREWEALFRVELTEPNDDDCAWDFDVLGFIESCTERFRGGIDGVVSSSDYPGATVAAAIATRLGLPGSRPRDVLRCSHKYYSRLAQREIVPEATAGFHLVAPGHPNAEIEFPCYIKPVKGAFSIMSQKIRDRRELDAFLAKPSVAEFLKDYLAIFNQLVRALTGFEYDGSWFLAEELLTGRQATVEGFVAGGEVRFLGIVDSIRHPRTKSFVRFDYPSSLPQPVQSRMSDVARRVITHLGLEQTLFNVEMMYNERLDRISIVEINPRMCGQFADLYAKVDGTHGHEVALALAAGSMPRLRRREGRFRVASSVPLRIYQPSRVARAPSPSEIATVEEAFPETLIWNECASADVLADFESEDGKSARYGVVNLGASDRKQLTARYEDVVRSLDYRFEKC